MKKLLVLVFLSFFAWGSASANVPDGTYFFMDNKGYDESGTQTFFCFEDGSCYTTEGAFAFVRELQNKVAELEQKVTDLQNQLAQQQAPVIQQPTQNTQPAPAQPSEPSPVASNLRPAYTSDEIRVLFNIESKGGHRRGPSGDSITSMYKWPIMSVNFPTSLYYVQDSHPLNKNLKVRFNGQIILENGKNAVSYTDADGVQVAVGERSGYTVPGLNYMDTYTYELVYTEAGRQETVIPWNFKAGY